VQIAFVGFRGSGAESGLLRLAARSTEFAQSTIDVRNNKGMPSRQSAAASGASIPGNVIHHDRAWH